MRKVYVVLLWIICGMLITACTSLQPATYSSSAGASTQSNEKKDLKFLKSNTCLKLVPDKLEDYKNDYLFHLVEEINGKEERISASIQLLNPQYTTAIQKVADNTYSLKCISNSDLYVIGSDSMQNSAINASTNDQYKIHLFDQSPWPSYLYLSFDYQDRMDISVYQHLDSPWSETGGIYINANDIGDKRNIYTSIFLKDSDRQELVNVNGDFGILKSIYTHIFAAQNKQYFYYDSVDSDGIPKIYIVKTGNRNPIDGKITYGVVYKNKACHPVVSEDNSILAYNYSDDASFSDACIWQTIIEKGRNLKKQYNSMRIILMDNQENEIYVLDPEKNKLEILSMSNLQIKGTGDIDKGIIFPQIYNGKLQYTCPVYSDGKITDYIVKEEQD